MATLTNAQKAELAYIVINHVADLFEDWDQVTGEKGSALLKSIVSEGPSTGDPVADEQAVLMEIRDQVARWMRRLPGEYWDKRLGL